MFADIESRYEGTLHIRARELRSGNDWDYK
jgi:hypothetical protein